MSHDFIGYVKSIFEADLLDIFQKEIMPSIYAKNLMPKNLMPFLSRTAASFRVSTHLFQFIHLKKRRYYQFSGHFLGHLLFTFGKRPFTS